MRSIMHFYLRSFYASLEQLKDPQLEGKPVVITHKSRGGEFVVSASREAIAQGVSESMSARHASRYCPTAVFLPARWKMYHEASNRVMDILSKFSPLLEPDSFDKAYIDVTGCHMLFGSAKEILKEAQLRIKNKVGVASSVGIAQNKLLASIASRLASEDGYIEVKPDSNNEFLHPLSVRHLWGVSEKIEKRLLALGVRTIGELALIPEDLLIRQFGILGSKLYRLSHGIDYSPVMPLYPPALIEIEHTFDHTTGIVCEPELAEVYLFRMCDCLAMKLWKRNVQASVISVKLEFEGAPTISSSYILKASTSSAKAIYSSARRIIRSEMHGAPLKSMKLTLSGLRSGGEIQLSFSGDTERRMKLNAVVETIRSRFGEHAIVCGCIA